jgi:hypothetical protein
MSGPWRVLFDAGRASRGYREVVRDIANAVNKAVNRLEWRATPGAAGLKKTRRKSGAL